MKRDKFRALEVALATLILALTATGCYLISGGEEPREEMVGGVLIPIPGSMSKSTERRVELALPGIEGGTVTYQGSADPKDLISFYQIEMPRRGWTPKGSLVSQGGALAFTKESRSVLIRVSESGGGMILSGGVTILDILVGSLSVQIPSPVQEKSNL